MKTVIDSADVLAGLAQWLHDEGQGVYRTDSPFEAGERAITLYGLPTQPDYAVAVALYGVDDALLTPDSTASVQLRFRAPADTSPVAVDAWADSVAAKLHFKHRFTMGALRVARAERTIVAPMGVDDNGRPERADSYQLILARN